jgi:hypothetical protein
MRLVLHIGMNKTGSSAIQAFLERHLPPVHESGILYPRSGRSIPNPPPFPVPDLAREVRAALASDTPPHTAVVSNENLHRTDLRALSRELALHLPPSLVPRIEVIAFVREHLSYLSSHYRDAVKTPSSSFSGSFLDFVSLSDASHVHWMRATRAAFPHSTFIPYGSDSVQAFLAAARLPLPDPFPPSYRENPGISGNLLFLARIVNAHVPHRIDTHELHHLALLDPSFTAPMHVPPALESRILDSYAFDRAHLAREFGLSFPPAPPLSQAPPVTALSPDLTRLPRDRDLIITTQPTAFAGLVARYTR